MIDSLRVPACIATGDTGPVLQGELTVPKNVKGVVVFAPGSGTGRNSPHNLVVATRLQEVRLATLLIDLLDEHEARDYHNVFDEELIATRLAHAARWLAHHPSTRSLPLGYFGASTGAAAALIAAASDPQHVSAVVSTGGRPDLASSWLHRVHTPTLLLVGGLDDDMALSCNRDAYQRIIAAEKSLVVIRGAGHLFEEPGTLEDATDHARRWFVRHLCTVRTGPALHGVR